MKTPLESRQLTELALKVSRRAARARRKERRDAERNLRDYHSLHRNWAYMSDDEKRLTAKLAKKLGLMVDLPA